MSEVVGGEAGGGAPQRREEFLPFYRPSVGEEEIAAVSETLRSGWLTTGAKVRQLEERIAERVGCPAAVAVNSCTAALHLALAVAGVEEGDEVITTPYTFAATGEVILYGKARPVFADVERATGNLDPEQFERAITPRTKAVMPVHIAGVACRMDEITAIAERHGLEVIEDAAHALGTFYNGRPVGSLSRFTCLSFYATKNLTTGEGGMVCLNRQEDAARVRRLSLHGLSQDAWDRYTEAGSWAYAIEEMGYKYNLTDVAAAIGLCQLDRFDAIQQRRRELALQYLNLLADCDALELPQDQEGHAWHLFLLRLRPERLSIHRNEFARRLQEANIGISVHFIPLHLHPLYRNALGHQEGDFPVAEEIFQRTISLPFYPGMTSDDVEYVASMVRWLATEFRR
jgi:perosamine synthetase